MTDISVVAFVAVVGDGAVVDGDAWTSTVVVAVAVVAVQNSVVVVVDSTLVASCQRTMPCHTLQSSSTTSYNN